jgi:hypothetical protein
LTAEIDRLCACIGASRAGQITSVERWRSEERGYNVHIDLVVEGRKMDYSLRFDGQRRLLTFWPEEWSPHTAKGTGFDTVKDPALRRFLIERVEATNRCLHHSLFPPIAIQPDARYFQVTYYAVPAKTLEEKPGAFMDPYFSFTVTRKGTVIAFRGPSA